MLQATRWPMAAVARALVGLCGICSGRGGLSPSCPTASSIAASPVSGASNLLNRATRGATPCRQQPRLPPAAVAVAPDTTAMAAAASGRRPTKLPPRASPSSTTSPSSSSKFLSNCSCSGWILAFECRIRTCGCRIYGVGTAKRLLDDPGCCFRCVGGNSGGCCCWVAATARGSGRAAVGAAAGRGPPHPDVADGPSALQPLPPQPWWFFDLRHLVLGVRPSIRRPFTGSGGHSAGSGDVH
jgi:hypothetical protein